MKHENLTYILDEDNSRVLMVKKGMRPGDVNSGLYTLPGGGIEPQEMEVKDGKIKAARREVIEETGVIPIRISLVGTILFNNQERMRKGNPFGQDHFVQIYRGTADYQELSIREKDIIPLWIPEYKLKDPRKYGIDMHKGDKFIFDWLGERKSFEGVITHTGEEIDYSKTYVKYSSPN